MHKVIETTPSVYAVFFRDESRPMAFFTDQDSASLYATMRSVLVDIRETTGENRTDAFNALADFAERHYREIVKHTPGIRHAMRPK